MKRPISFIFIAAFVLFYGFVYLLIGLLIWERNPIAAILAWVCFAASLIATRMLWKQRVHAPTALIAWGVAVVVAFLALLAPMVRPEDVSRARDAVIISLVGWGLVLAFLAWFVRKHVRSREKTTSP
jgi:hypothetical protein